MSLTLRDAEGMLVARCTSDVAALRLCLETLPVRPFRSGVAEDLHAVFYLLAGWLARDTYDGQKNMTHLAIALTELEPKNGYHQSIESWTNWLDSLWHSWTPWTVTPEEIAGLLDDLMKAYALQDAAVAATRASIETNPFEPDQGYEDALYIRLQEVLIRRRQQRRAPTIMKTTEVPPPPVNVDWEEVLRRVPE